MILFVLFIIFGIACILIQESIDSRIMIYLRKHYIHEYAKIKSMNTGHYLRGGRNGRDIYFFYHRKYLDFFTQPEIIKKFETCRKLRIIGFLLIGISTSLLILTLIIKNLI